MAINYATYAVPREDLGEAYLEYQYEPDQVFIGNRVFAPSNVDLKAAKFPRITRESLLRTANVKRASGANYSRDEFEAEDVEYSCQERGHEVPIDMGEAARFAGDFNAEFLATRVAMWRVMLDQEKDVAAAVFDGTTNFTTVIGNRTDVSTAWSTQTTDIMADVFAAKEKVRARTGMEPNKMIMPAIDMKNLLTNDDIRAAIHYTRLPSVAVVMSALEELFGLQLLIGKGVYNSAVEGADYSQTEIWGTGWAMVFVGCEAGASRRTACLGRTLHWTSAIPAETTAETYHEPQTNSIIYRARSFADELMLDTGLGQLLDTAA